MHFIARRSLRVCDMCLNSRVFLFAISLIAVFLQPIDGRTRQPFGYTQSELASAILPKAKVVLHRLPISSAVSVLRMMLDLECEDEVSIYLDRLGSVEHARMLKLLIYESGHFGSLLAINYAVDRVPANEQKDLIVTSCRSLANGKHFSIAIELSKTRLRSDEFDAIAVDIATYAYIFGETALARELINNADTWEILLADVLIPRRNKFIELEEFESKLGIDDLWSEILSTHRINACTPLTSEKDLQVFLNSGELSSLKLCALFTWCASLAVEQLHSEGRPYYDQFADLLTRSDRKTQMRWNGERVFLAVQYEDEKFIHETLQECIQKGSFDIASACAGMSLRNYDMTVKLATLAQPLKSDDAYFLSAAMRNEGLLGNLAALPDLLQVQLVAALHLSLGQKQKLEQKQP